MKQYIITDLPEGLVNITKDQLLEIGREIPSTIQNLQSVLEQGSEAVIGTEFSIQNANGNGRIALTEEGVKIEGQAKGFNINGQEGVSNIGSQGAYIRFENARISSETHHYFQGQIRLGNQADSLLTFLERLGNGGFKFYSPGDSQIIIDYGKVLEINGNLKLSGESLTVIEDSTFGLVLDGQNRIKRQLLPSGSSEVSDATTTTKGIVQLAGDLAGTAEAPTVPALSGKENTSNKVTTLTNSDTDYPTTKVVTEAIAAQATRPLLNTNFNTNDLIDDLPQCGREINLQNTSNIETTVKAGTFSTYFKGGTGNIKFVADTGRTLKLMDATDMIDGIVGSYAKVKSFGTVDYIYINNYE